MNIFGESRPRPRDVQSDATHFYNPRVCPRPEYETLLTSLAGGLLREGTMPPGAIVDSGAFMGQWACWYACQDTRRTVYAIEVSSVS